MSARPVEAVGIFRAAPRARDRPRLACIFIALLAALAMGGCTSGPSAPGGPTTAAQTPSSGTSPSEGTPDKVYTDQELMAIINAVARNRQVQGGAMDSQRLRSAVGAGTGPLPAMETTPADCVVFAPRSPFAVWADKSVNMAEGGIPIAAPSGPTTTIMLTLRSAEKDAISQADSNYTDDLAARCGQFDLAFTEYGKTSTHAVRLLNAPSAGEMRFAWMQKTTPQQPEDFGSAGLQVLAGTLSVSLTLSVSELNSEADARPALDSMAGLAQELIDEAMQHPPSGSTVGQGQIQGSNKMDAITLTVARMTTTQAVGNGRRQ